MEGKTPQWIEMFTFPKGCAAKLLCPECSAQIPWQLSDSKEREVYRKEETYRDRNQRSGFH